MDAKDKVIERQMREIMRLQKALMAVVDANDYDAIEEAKNIARDAMSDQIDTI